MREGRSAVFSASIAPHYKARLALKVCAVLSAAAKWIHSVISATPTGLTHFIGGAPLAALSDAVYWAATGQWGTAVISDEAAGASIAAYSYTLASITTGTGARSFYSEPLRMSISYEAGVFFRLTPDLRGRHLHRLAHRRLRDAALHGHHRRRRRLAHGSGRPGCLSALTVFLCKLVFYGACV